MTVDIDTDRDTAWLAVFEASRARLFSLAYRILGVRADAEDVVQDTFVKWHLHQRATPFDALETPAAWLATVAKRTAIDRLRRLQHEALVQSAIDGFDSMASVDYAPSAEMLAEQTSDLSYGMRRVLERLSVEERAAFLLREAFEEDYASIAKLLNRSAAHCRQMVHRAKDRVRDERRSNDTTRAPHSADAIEPLLDAIARQDVDALVALTLASSPATATAASAEFQAAMLTRALIARLRIGRIDLRTGADHSRVTDPVAA